MYSGGALVKTAARVLAVLSVAIAVWSLNVAWGDDPSLRGGPPAQWERQVVGAALLAGVAAALALYNSRPGAHRAVRAAGLVAALGPGLVAIYLRSDASSMGLPQLLTGPGWTWLAVGSALALLAAASTFFIQRIPERRRARGR
jgi:hypothetical protein